MREVLSHLDSCGLFDGSPPFPTYKGPWGGKCILHSQDAAPTGQASEMHLSVRERIHTQKHKPKKKQKQKHKPVTAMEDRKH